MSIKRFLDSIEPGTPGPDRRLAVCAALSERGLRCGVLMGPVVPFLSDSPEQLDEAVRKIASGRRGPRHADRAAPAAGRQGVVPALAAREHTRSWSDAYRDLYGVAAYAPASYQRQITAQVAELARKYGVGRTTPGRGAPRRPRPPQRRASAGAAGPRGDSGG